MDFETDRSAGAIQRVSYICRLTGPSGSIFVACVRHHQITYSRTVEDVDANFPPSQLGSKLPCNPDAGYTGRGPGTSGNMALRFDDHLRHSKDIQNSDWQNFISQSISKGIKVEALIGNPQWVIGTGTPSLQSQLDWIKLYQAAAAANSSFAGIHMDVEPWGLDDWEANKAKYIEGWEGVAQKVASLASSLGITVAADLPFWANTLDSTIAGQTVDIWMLNLLDYATFMTYRNTVSALLDIAAPVLAAGNDVGKPVWLAVETIQLPEDNLSYYGQPVSKLQSDLNEIATAVQGQSSFAGIAVHDYDGWSALPSTA